MARAHCSPLTLDASRHPTPSYSLDIPNVVMEGENKKKEKKKRKPRNPPPDYPPNDDPPNNASIGQDPTTDRN